jgi:hypothetical protein
VSIAHKIFYSGLMTFSLQMVAEAQGLKDAATALTSAEIRATFDNVIDNAEVLDSPGVSAETYWRASGTFETRWSSSQRSGEAKGLWRVQDNRRCVKLEDPKTLTVAGGEPAESAVWRCGAILSLPDGRLLSLNPDGSPHGVHRLTPMP